MECLNVVLVKPSKYGRDGYVERFRRGFMPNATIPYMHTLLLGIQVPVQLRVHTVDEYVRSDLEYLNLFHTHLHGPTLLLLVGVQSHQLHRALDLGALAHQRGCMVALGGPHAMTCDTSVLQGRGISFAQSEAEVVLEEIVSDAIDGRLKDVYGEGQRWARELDPPSLHIPDATDVERHLAPFLGVYPSRGCPFICDFCSVIKIFGRVVRSEPIATTMETLRRAKAAGVKEVMITSDNFNKIPHVRQLCRSIIDADLGLKFFVQCDTQIWNDPELIELFAKTGVFEIFLGVESLDAATLRVAHKTQNRPDKYVRIRELCDQNGIGTHFSMILGFPGDTEERILEQLELLKEIEPTNASFYTLCPIPGTEQYKDFKIRGLISEENLDRFDGTCPTWRHPHLSSHRLYALFRRCYREFYSVRHAARYRKKHGITRSETWLRMLFVRWCAFLGKHPMSGGIGITRLDQADSYMPLRRATFGFDRAPLPDCLELTPADAAYNRTAKLRIAAE